MGGRVNNNELTVQLAVSAEEERGENVTRLCCTMSDLNGEAKKMENLS